MVEAIDAARVDRDTLGGLLEVRAFGVPPGLGSYTEPRLRLDARLAAAALGIQAMKGVEIGDGFANSFHRGSEVHDELFYDDARGYHRTTNRAGGVEGGMSNGETIVLRIAMKPIPTLMRPLRSARLDTHEAADALVERSDTTAIAAAAVVAEAVVAFELARCVRESFGGDHVDDMLAAYRAYLARIPWHRPEIPADRARRLHGRRQDDGRAGPRPASATPVRRSRSRGGARGRRPDRRAVRARGRAGIPRARGRGRRVAPGPDDAPVISLGGGALGDPATRALLRERALVVWLDVDRATAWARAVDATRPLTADRAQFDRLWEERRDGYREAADAIVDGGMPAAAVAAAIAQQVWTRPGALTLAESDGRLFRVVDRAVADRVDADLVLEGGEGEKSAAGLERLWRAFAEAGLERGDRVLAVGGGAVTDVVGFAAATFRRGIGWIAGPTTFVGQVDAAIGGKTAIDVVAKNDVGAFWSPQGVLADPDLLATLPQREWAARLCRVHEDGAARRWPVVGSRPPARRRAPQRAAQAELVRRAQDSRRSWWREDPTRDRAACDPQPRAHDRPRRRGGRRLRRRCATARRSRSAWSRRCGSRRGSPGSTRRSPTRSRRCSPRTGCRARRRASRPTRARRDAPRQEARRAARTASCCSRRVGRPVLGVEVPDDLLAEVVAAAVAAPSRLRAMHVHVLNGVNLGMLGTREPDVYGKMALNELESRIYAWARELGLTARCMQTDHEGEYVQAIHEAIRTAGALIVNPARGRTTPTRSATRSRCSRPRSSRCT